MKKTIRKSFYNSFFKKFLDILISLIAILVLSPILLLLYILNVIFVGFPTIFKQPRPGKNNKIFYIYKFRSMNNKKDKDGNLLPDSQRITLWGKIMRKTSLDELPQLFCILTGKMSIVGPRPRLVKDIIFYDKETFESYTATPGLTGPTQTTGRNENTWEQVFEKDKEYNNNITFAKDIKIFFKTFLSVFISKGESHDNSEEDKKQIQEYYYADYLLRIGKISKEQYDYGMQLAKDIIAGKKPMEYHPELLDKNLFDAMQDHKHAIFVIKNNQNEFLQYFDEKWNCLLFPNCKLDNNDNNNKELVSNYLKSTFGITDNNYKIRLISNKIHSKFSVNHKKDKVYNHFIYEILVNKTHINDLINDKKYSWKTFEELENDENAKKYNGDIIDFVKNSTKKHTF